MKKKIIFFDVDYTIYSHKTNSIPPSCIEGIKKAKDNGYLIVLATGRSKELTALLGIFDVIDFDYFVTINGTLVMDKNNNIIFSKPISKRTVNKIMCLTDKLNLKTNVIYIKMRIQEVIWVMILCIFLFLRPKNIWVKRYIKLIYFVKISI